MKILLINDLSHAGGTESQHWLEFALLNENGHDVYSITLDDGVSAPFTSNCYSLNVDKSVFTRVFGRIYSIGLSRKLRNLIEEIKPDIIHLNNANLYPVAVYSAIRNWPSLQTIRDYSVVCPKSTCIHKDGNECQGFDLKSCLVCSFSVKNFIKAITFKSVKKIRLQSCNAFVAPSQALAKKSSCSGVECVQLRDGFRNTCEVQELDVLPQFKTYFYYGGIRDIKGVPILIEAFEKFAQNKNDVRLCLAGKVENLYANEFFERIRNSKADIEYLGILEHKDVLEVVSSSYCIVVPSLWIENYPNTVLESIMSKRLVIGSNRGGIPELILNQDLLFDILDGESIVSTLNLVNELSKLEYKTIIDKAYARVSENCSLSSYYHSLMTMFSSILERK